MGLLTATGTIDVNQFWPHGLSDADTATVVVENFFYSPTGKGKGTPTSVFWNAIVKGNASKPAVRQDKKDKDKKITIRLQGIDAPELHYRPAPLGRKGTDSQKAALKKVNKEYRQHLGETAADALGQQLRKFANASGIVKCSVVTHVDKPTEVFDMYGRFIGDIVVDTGSKAFNANEWLAKEGWAFPTFYTSMSPKEIQTYLDAWKVGSKVKGRLGKYYEGKIVTFDQSLVFRRGGPADSKKDLGNVNMPKIFRRQTTWWAYKQAGVTKGTFPDYVAQGTDEFLLTKDFLSMGIHSAPTQKLGSFFKGNTFTLKPQEMVFKEGASKLVTPSGKEIVTW